MMSFRNMICNPPHFGVNQNGQNKNFARLHSTPARLKWDGPTELKDHPMTGLVAKEALDILSRLGVPQSAFAKDKDRVEKAAKDAEAALDSSEAAELEKAEAEGRSHARK